MQTKILLRKWGKPFTNKYITKGSGSRKFRLHFNFLCSTVVVNGEQKIIHEQEVPEFKREYLLNFPEPIAAKVYVIDDGDHCTMLLAEEY